MTSSNASIRLRRRLCVSSSFCLAAASAVLLAAAPLAAPLAAQPPAEAEGFEPLQSFGEEVSVEVVNVQVWVSDRRGRPVTGLGQGDFELLVDGKPVPVTNFSEISESGPAAQTPAASLPARSLERVPDAERLHVVVLVDNWNLRPEDRSRVLGDLRGFLGRSLRPGEQAMVVTYDGRSLRVAQSYTDDQEALGRSLDQVERLASEGVHLDSERRQAFREVAEAYQTVLDTATRRVGDDPCEDAWPDMENAVRSYAAEAVSHAQGSISALSSVIKSQVGIPGGKVLLYVGNGLPDQPGVDLYEYIRQLCPATSVENTNFAGEYDLSTVYAKVADQANAEGVTLYTLEAEDPSRLLEADDQPADPRYRVPSTVLRLHQQALQAPLQLLAGETGGRAILDATDFTRPFAAIGSDLRSYYSLGFSPRGPDDGSRHRIEVRVPGEGYRVRHRTSFVAKPFEQRLVERIRGVAGLADQRNPLGVRLETGEMVARPDGRVSVPLRIWVPLDAVTLVPGKDGLHGQLRVLMAIGEPGGRLSPVRQKLVPVDVKKARSKARGPDEPGGQKLVEVTLALPAGDALVAMGLRDELGGEVAYLRQTIHVVQPPPAGVASPPEG